MSYGHVELVYQQSTHQGAAHQVLAYLALRANENHICWPGNNRMAADLRISLRSVAYAVKALAEAGDILQIRQGNGQGNATTWQLGQQYWPLKDEQTASFEADNHAAIAPISDIDNRKGATTAQRVQSATSKGATTAPQHKENNKENNKNEEVGAQAPPAATAKEIEQEYMTRFYERTGYHVGTLKARILVDGLGSDVDWDVVDRAFVMWIGESYPAAKLNGIIDWYHNLKVNPNWLPPAAKRGHAPAGPNGNQPKTFDQIRAENNRKATEDFKRLIRQGAGNG